MTPKIEKLVVKYLTNSATASDLDMLSRWIENPLNKKVFKDYIETHIAINHNMSEPETQKVIDQFLTTIRKEKSFVKALSEKWTYKYAVAASIMLIVALTLFLKRGDSINEAPAPILTNSQIVPGTDKATLTLEDNSVVELTGGKSLKTPNAISNGEEIVYNDLNESVSELKYNYLTIPRGGQFTITLSDGTKVWLNSESQIKYPVAFQKGADRKVELIYGEAYFDVSPSVVNQGSKFIVYHNLQEVEVLGTEFNIKAYRDESNIYTTLVEGKVAVSNESFRENLSPNQQSNLNIDNGKMTISTVDVYREISWKDGIFSFVDLPLKDIMKVMSRWYDVEVVFENKGLGGVQFIGTLNKNQSIEEILSIMQSTTINGYEIKGKTITIR